MPASAEDHFAKIAGRFLELPDVTPRTGFGASPGLRTGRRIFAMLVADRLVVKLPRPRVDALVAAGVARRFDPGHGRPMKEWASVELGGGSDWEALAVEAHRFVAGGP